MVALVCLDFNIDCVNMLSVYYHIALLIIHHCCELIVIFTVWNTGQQRNHKVPTSLVLYKTHVKVELKPLVMPAPKGNFLAAALREGPKYVPDPTW